MNSALNANDNTVTLTVPGDLVSTTAEALRQEAERLLESAGEPQRKWNTFILNLSAAKMVDSVGLNLVVLLLKRVQKFGGKMQITYSSPNVLRTFSFTRLDKHIGLVKA